MEEETEKRERMPTKSSSVIFFAISSYLETEQSNKADERTFLTWQHVTLLLLLLFRLRLNLVPFRQLERTGDLFACAPINS